MLYEECEMEMVTLFVSLNLLGLILGCVCVCVTEMSKIN